MGINKAYFSDLIFSYIYILNTVYTTWSVCCLQTFLLQSTAQLVRAACPF